MGYLNMETLFFKPCLGFVWGPLGFDSHLFAPCQPVSQRPIFTHEWRLEAEMRPIELGALENHDRHKYTILRLFP